MPDDVAKTRAALAAALHAVIDEFHRSIGQTLPEGVEHWPSEAVLMLEAEAHAKARALAVLSKAKEAVVGFFDWDEVDGEDDLAQLDVLFEALREELEAEGE